MTARSKSRGIPGEAAYSRFLSNLCLDLSLSSEVTSRVTGYARARDWMKLLAFADDLSLQIYESAEEHLRYNQLVAVIKKVPFTCKGLDPEGAAFSRFQKSEFRCRRINQRFRARRARDEGRRPYQGLLSKMKDEILKVIGHKPNMDRIYSACYFGPGSSYDVAGDLTHIMRKINGFDFSSAGGLEHAIRGLHRNQTITRAFFERWRLAGHDTYETLYDYVVGNSRSTNRQNRLAFVPKTAKVHRGIAVEPTLNGFVQNGVGVEIARLLTRVGIDLRDQERNQHLAKLGSLGGRNPFCTLDLAQASDSLAIEVVRELLPPAWFELLYSIRSAGWCYNQLSGTYEKIANMGNGFCFPLETLIFYAACRAVFSETGDVTCSVYGDDIIVPQNSALYVIELLAYLGFKTNVDKTFVHGPFRESCGADFFEGKPVRPYTLKVLPSTTADFINVHNCLLQRGEYLLASAGLRAEVAEHERYVTPYKSDQTTSAFFVPMDLFMASRFSRYHGNGVWSWVGLKFTPILDHPEKRGPAYELLCLLAGGAPVKGAPALAFRRRKRQTAVRFNDPDRICREHNLRYNSWRGPLRPCC